MNLCCFKLYRAYPILFNSSNVGKFFWSWILKDVIKVQKKKTKGIVLCSRPLQNVKLGTFTLQWRSCNEGKKSVMHVQSCCFANPNQLLFCSSRCRCCRCCRCLSSLVRQSFREVASYESRTARDLHEEKCGHIKFVVIHAVSKSSFHTLSNVVDTAISEIRPLYKVDA